MNEEREYRPFEGAIGATGAGCVTGAGALRQKEMPKAGEWWWVKMPDKLALLRRKVTGVTEKTIEIKAEEDPEYPFLYRYKLSDTDLVERCEDQGE